MAPIASKPKPTFYSHNNNKYQFLCAATPTSLDRIRQQLGLTINSKFRNGNVQFYCKNNRSNPRRRCNYLALFVARENAVYVMSGRVHSHPVDAQPANEEAEDEPEQDLHHQEEDESNDESIGEDTQEEEEEAMKDEDGEPPMKQEEANDEEPLVVEEKRFFADVHNAQHLDELCSATALEETERLFKCKHPNCPFRASFVSDQSKLYVINQHNH